MNWRDNMGMTSVEQILVTRDKISEQEANMGEIVISLGIDDEDEDDIGCEYSNTCNGCEYFTDEGCTL